MAKYRMTDDVIVTCERVLHRIEALVDIQRFCVKAGDVGGFIEHENNLSQCGDAWVDDHAQIIGGARVCGNAYVGGDAHVYGNSLVYGNANVCENARVSDNAQVYDDAWVYEDAMVYGYADVCGHVQVRENAQVYGHAHLHEYAQVCGCAQVHGCSRVHGSAIICSNAQVRAEGHVCGDARIMRNAEIVDESGYVVCGPCGSRDGFTTFYKTETGIWVSCGCFNGSIEKFLDKVEETHGDNKHGRTYKALAELARMKIGGETNED